MPVDYDYVFFNDHEPPAVIDKVFYVHKHQVSLEYGGPEEGGWWFDMGIPTGFSLGPISNEEAAYEQARCLNQLEHERREREEKYEYTSVYGKMSNHYDYRVEDFPEPESYPKTRPHYE